MSNPPTNCPFTYICGYVGQSENFLSPWRTCSSLKISKELNGIEPSRNNWTTLRLNPHFGSCGVPFMNTRTLAEWTSAFKLSWKASSPSSAFFVRPSWSTTEPSSCEKEPKEKDGDGITGCIHWLTDLHFLQNVQTSNERSIYIQLRKSGPIGIFLQALTDLKVWIKRGYKKGQFIWNESDMDRFVLEDVKSSILNVFCIQDGDDLLAEATSWLIMVTLHEEHHCRSTGDSRWAIPISHITSLTLLTSSSDMWQHHSIPVIRSTT